MALPDAGGPETTPEPAGSGKPEEAQETAAPAAAAETPRERSFTLTAGGAIALNGELRKNTLSADSKKYDYSDIMLLLARELTSDMNLAFLENILSDDYKASDIIAPETAADLLRSGGFTHIACGFPRAYEKGADGIAATWMSLSERRIKPLGIFDTDDKNRLTIFEINGIKTALLQYSANVAAKTRKAMEKDGAAGAVPEASAEIVAADIQNCRSQGVQAVIVLLDWGKAGKDPLPLLLGPLQLLRGELQQGGFFMGSDTEIRKTQREQIILALLDRAEPLFRDGFPGAYPGGQTGVGGLIPGEKPRLVGEPPDPGLGEPAEPQRGQDLQLPQGTHAGPVSRVVGGVGPVQQKRIAILCRSCQNS
jgi:hypothetical protein